MPARQPDDVLVSTAAGVVRGRRDRGVRVFLGVPYAAPPFGMRRFAAPAPVTRWDGVRDALRFGATVPKGEYAEFARPLLPDPVIPGEDCLHANVWAPEGAERAPVLVWVHGGSFEMGSNAVPEYDGSAFARSGVVAVTLNYRLGAEGFLQLEDAPANRALLDVTAALRWVRANIAAFGGDPGRVTLAGQSAGAMIIGSVLAMPEARGLFSAAIMASGADANVLSAPEAALTTAAVTERLGRPATRASLGEVAPEKLVEIVSAVTADVAANPQRWGSLAVKRQPFAPVVDGVVLPSHPLRQAGGAAVPLLLGTTRDEFRLFLPAPALAAVDEAHLAGLAAAVGLPAAGLAAYRARSPQAPPGDVLAEVLGDHRFLLPALALAEARGSRAPTWLFRFDALEREDNNGLGSAHSTDVPFVFGTTRHPLAAPRLGPDPSPAAAALVHDRWVRFVREHDPGWPPYTQPRRAVGLLGDTLVTVDDPYAGIVASWQR